MIFRLPPTQRTKSRILSLVFGLFFVLMSPQDFAATVIVNPNVGADAVTLSEVRAIFSMRLRRWSNGLPVTVFILKSETATHQDFCKSILNIYPHQLQAAWDRMVYSGTGKSPILVNSSDEMMAIVAATPGAIGYVDKIESDSSGVREILLK